MQLVPFIFKDPNSTAAQIRSRLNAHDPAQNPNLAGKDDLRGFEWHYDQHLLERSASVFSGHDAPVIAGVFTPDGHLATLDQDGQFRRWDLDSGQEEEASRRDLPGGHGAQVRVLSPSGGLAAFAVGNKVHVFATSTGKETFSIDSPDVKGINGNKPRRLIFSRDGDWLVIVDDRIRWCGATSGEVIASLDQKFIRTEGLALSADGLTLAVVGLGGFGMEFSVFRLDATTRTVTPGVKDLNAGVPSHHAAALSLDGRRLAIVSSMDGAVTVLDTTTGRRIASAASAHASTTTAVTFTGNGATLATADGEGTIKIWSDTQTLNAKGAARLVLKGHQGKVESLSFSSDGDRMVSTGADRTARVWDLGNTGPAIRPLERSGHSLMARFSPDGRLIASAAGSSLRLWDAATGRLVRELSPGDKGRLSSVAFSPTDSRLLAVGYGGTTDVSHIALWDIDGGSELPWLPGATDLPNFWVGEVSGVVSALAISPDGKFLVAGFGQKNWTPSPYDDPNPLRVWDLATRRLIGRLEGHTDYCRSLDFSRDGTLLASGSIDGTVILWSTATWNPVRRLDNPDKDTRTSSGRPGHVEDVALSPDGKTLAMASGEKNVHLWDVATGKCLETLKGHSSAVKAVAFSPDGRTLASGSADQTVRLWNVETRRELMRLDPGRGDLGMIYSVTFSPDGTRLLAGAGTTAFWTTAPIVWNDPEKAAESLRDLLRSNAVFSSRIRMFSENLRLHEALERLDASDVRVRAALAATQANWHASRKEWSEAALAFDRLVAADPTRPGAWLLAPGLLRVATALAHRDRPDAAARLLEGVEDRLVQDGLWHLRPFPTKLESGSRPRS